jgi:uncharacterized protein YkwD
LVWPEVGVSTPSEATGRAPARPPAARRTVSFALTTFLLAILLSVATSPSPALAATQPEQTLYSIVTGARTARGLSPIPLSEDLSAVARKHSARMAQQGGLFHTPCLTCRISGGGVLAENVGFGSTLRRIHRMMMGSAGHRANILGAFNQVGVGVVQKGGRFWVTEIFVA